MKQTFINLCELWALKSFCEQRGDYTSAIDTCKRLMEVSEKHPILSAITRYLYPFFV